MLLSGDFDSPLFLLPFPRLWRPATSFYGQFGQLSSSLSPISRKKKSSVKRTKGLVADKLREKTETAASTQFMWKKMKFILSYLGEEGRKSKCCLIFFSFGRF